MNKSLDLGTFHIHKHLLYVFYPLSIKYHIVEILLNSFCDLNTLSSLNWKGWVLQGGLLGFQSSLSPQLWGQSCSSPGSFEFIFAISEERG